MINLLSTLQKEDIRAARLNVKLRNFAVLSLVVTLGILTIYGVGFYFVMQEQGIANRQLDQDKTAGTQYQKVISEAKAYKTNLTIAKKVLSTGMSYSTFLTETAHALPAGSVLIDLSLANLGASPAPLTSATANKLTLNTRTTSYGGALQIKENLENSDLFSNVSLVDITMVDTTDTTTAIDKKYPFKANLSMSITTPKVTGR